MKKDWLLLATDFLRTEGLHPMTKEEYLLAIPEAVREDLLQPVPDPRALLGFRPPDERIVKRHFNTLAPYYEIQMMPSFDIEANATAYLARTIARLKPDTVVDAGCGTGLTTAFLAKHFPGTVFYAYDTAINMVRQAKARCKRLSLTENTNILLLSHAKAERMLPWDRFEMIFTKCSFGLESAYCPDFDDLPSPSTGLDEFCRCDPAARQWRNDLHAFHVLLRQHGRFFDIGAACRNRDLCVGQLADEIGLRPAAVPEVGIYASREIRVIANIYQKA
jgi:SAM-dependent methyltransferase